MINVKKIIDHEQWTQVQEKVWIEIGCQLSSRVYHQAGDNIQWYYSNRITMSWKRYCEEH